MMKVLRTSALAFMAICATEGFVLSPSAPRLFGSQASRALGPVSPSGPKASRAGPRVLGPAGLKAQAASPVELKGDGCVLGPAPSGRFDSGKFGGPVVKKYKLDNGEEFWRMWYHGRDKDFDKECFGAPSGRIGLCESLDGINWDRLDGDQAMGSIMGKNEDWWFFDTRHCGVGDIQFLQSDKIKGSETGETGSVYMMYLFGGDAEEVEIGGMKMGSGKAPEGKTVVGMRMRLGMALSFDGVHWTHFEGDHHSGAIFDVGEEGEWDELFHGWPQVVQHGQKDFRMYYNSWDKENGGLTVGLATSTDGFAWKKVGQIIGKGEPGSFNENGSGRRFVIEDPKKDQYLMYLEGINAENKHSFGLYKSRNGIDWELAQKEPVFEAGPEGAWDEGFVSSPCIVNMGDGTCRLYYHSYGKEDGTSGIGCAESVGDDWTQFKRISKLRLKSWP